MSLFLRGCFVAVGLLLAACGGDSATGPGKTTQVAGTWRFTWTNMQANSNGVTLICTSTMDFKLTQSGVDFSGVQSGVGRMTCTVSGEGVVVDDPISGETLISGKLNGDKVTFRLGSIEGPHSGTVTGTSMSGNATWTSLDEAGSAVSLTGTWTAARM